MLKEILWDQGRRFRTQVGDQEIGHVCRRLVILS